MSGSRWLKKKRTARRTNISQRKLLRSIYLSIDISIHRSIYRSIYLSTAYLCLSVCLYGKLVQIHLWVVRNILRRFICMSAYACAFIHICVYVHMCERVRKSVLMFFVLWIHSWSLRWLCNSRGYTQKTGSSKEGGWPPCATISLSRLWIRSLITSWAAIIFVIA